MPTERGKPGMEDTRRCSRRRRPGGTIRVGAPAMASSAKASRDDRRERPVANGAPAASPYSWFASLYDETAGFAAYPIIRDAVARSVARYQPAPAVAADVGCGTGLLLPWLAERAGRVYAVDRSPSMLRLAKARTQARELPVTFLRQDLRSLSLPEPADLITCTFDTLNYLLSADDLLEALRRFRDNLAACGVLLFDVVTGAAWLGAPMRRIQRLARPAFVTTWHIRTEPRRRLSMVDVRWRDRSTPLRPPRREVHVQRWHSLDVLRKRALQAGLRIREIRDLDTERVASAASHWVHVVATR